jgi:hypothetical protein
MPFVVAGCNEPAIDATLRLAEDPRGGRLVPTPIERLRAEKDAEIARLRAELETERSR